MRNLKKILALVLSLMMVLSVMVTASAADFSDADEIQYAEAVDVLNGLGILTGSQGKFAPNGTLTRAQAAKIITFIALGEDTDKLVKGTGSAQFSDVTGGWAYDYVSYCANEKIISGSQGKFFPDAEVTGYQFGKMVLNVLGIEGTYTGSGWELRVATALKSEDLLAGLADSFSLKAKLTREEAAQIAFNAMNYVTETVYGYRIYTETAGVKTYAKDFYATLAEAAVAASALKSAGAGDYKVDTTKVAVNNTLGHKGYGLASSPLTVDGITGRFWYVYDPTYAITGLFTDDVVLGTSSDGTTITKLTSPKGTAPYDADKFVAKLNPASKGGYDVYYNGTKIAALADGATTVADQVYYNTTATTVMVAASTTAASATDATVIGKGITVKLVDGDGYGYATKILVEASEYTTVAKIKTYAETKTKGAYTEYTFANGMKKVAFSTKVTTADKTTVKVYDGIAVGDKVLVTNLASCAVVAKAGSVTGKVTAYSSAGVFTIDGTKYYASAVAKSTEDTSKMSTFVTNISTNLNTEVTFALDANGYIVTPTTKVADQYVYVVVGSHAIQTLEGNKIVTSYAASVMFTDGSYADVTVAKVDDTTVDGSHTVGAGLYSYKVNSKGGYELKTVSGKAIASDALKTHKSELVANTAYANNSTKYIYAKTATVGTDTVLVGTTVYTGINAYPLLSFATGAYTLVEGGKIVDVVFVTSATAAVDKVDVAWYLGTYTTEYVDGKAVKIYDLVVDGKATTIENLDVSAVAAGDLIKVDQDNKASKLPLTSAKLVYTSGLLFGGADGGTFIQEIDAGVPVYTMTKDDGSVSVGDMTDLAMSAEDAETCNYFALTATVNGTTTIVAIYVVK